MLVDRPVFLFLVYNEFMVLPSYLKPVLNKLIASSETNLEGLAHELNHALTCLRWLHHIEPSTDRELQIAALLHDCERFFASKKINKRNFSNYGDYKSAHALNSAKIASKLLNNLGFKPPFVSAVADLIKSFDVGG